MKPNDIIGIAMARADLYAPALDAFIRRASRYMGSVSGLVKTLRQDENRIELTSARDASGMPGVRIPHRLHPQSVALFDNALAQGEKIVRAAGGQEAWVTGQRNLGHVAGGKAMGDDPATSVRDSYGRLQDAPGVVVAGGGLFPSIGAAFTILSLAERATDRMVHHAGEFA